MRWSAATIAIFYGFAKLNGAQFTVLDSELDRPLREVSGFWLTWYYFGYSWAYGNLIALTQIVAGLCLTQERFTLLGALILLPMAVNIVLIDLFYGVDPGGLVAAFALLTLVIGILWPHRGSLVGAVLGSAQQSTGQRRSVLSATGLCVAAFATTFWVANYNNRAPTAIDGVWHVTSASEVHEVDRVYFERNRAHLAIFRDTSGAYRRHHFELLPDDRIQVWLEWLRKGDVVYHGAYLRESERIMLYPPDRPAESLALERRPETE